LKYKKISSLAGIIILLIGILSNSCKDTKGDEFDMHNLYAWCIVPFDKLNRTPVERIDMLNDIGFSEYAYDWREDNLKDMSTEWRLARESNIKIRAVWLWLDARRDTIGQLYWANEELFQKLEEEKLQTEIWLGFHTNYFQGTPDENILKGKDIISYLHDRADSIGCTINLYNHGDWFGYPQNQIRIIEALPHRDIGIIYNFHHGYNQVQLIPKIINQMMPHLRSVNVNGIVEGEAEVVGFGEGNHEQDMLRTFIDAGYQGPIGILGHDENADVREVLKENLRQFFAAKNILSD